MESPILNPSLLLSPRDTAKALSISTRTLWSLTAAGQIPHLKVGRLVRYRPESVRAWLADRERTGR
ncbi:MAG: helix-turn-helix domain-containing protein [Pirellulales bacterium]